MRQMMLQMIWKRDTNLKSFRAPFSFASENVRTQFVSLFNRCLEKLPNTDSNLLDIVTTVTPPSSGSSIQKLVRDQEGNYLTYWLSRTLLTALTLQKRDWLFCMSVTSYTIKTIWGVSKHAVTGYLS